MKWQDHLTDAEREKLDRLSRARDDIRKAYAEERRLLKSRCEARMKREGKRDARKGA